MEIDWKVRVLFLLASLFASAFFSGSEVAFFSLDKKKIKNIFSRSEVFQHYLTELLDHPRRLLATILVGNTVVNVTAAIIAVSLALELALQYELKVNLVLTIQIILLTFLVLIFSEITPKVLALKNPTAFLKIAVVPIYWIYVLIFPLSEIITEIIKYFFSRIKIDKKKYAIQHEEIRELASIGLEKGTIEDEEHELIHSIVGFKSMTVNEIMTPRVDMIAISTNANFFEAINAITKSGKSRLPLFNDDLDDIVGVIYAKDLLPYFKNEELRKNLSLSKIARKPLFVPKTKMIDSLMMEFQEKKMHLAIVVDEYGGTAGLVSLEDIIEEIIGEIRDEYDKEEISITKINDQKYLVLGRTSKDELKDFFGFDFTSADFDFDTLAGFVLCHAGQIPKEDYSFEFENHKFTVKEIINKRIKKILIEKIE